MLVSDSEVVVDSDAVPSAVAAGVVSVDVLVDAAAEESLFAAASARCFLALAARSLRSALSLASFSSFCWYWYQKMAMLKDNGGNKPL